MCVMTHKNAHATLAALELLQIFKKEKVCWEDFSLQF